MSESVSNPKVLNHDEFDFKNSTIINPGFTTNLDKEREAIQKETLVMIDSRLRNTESYPFPSKYVIDLDDDIQDVISAELIVSEIPFKMYLVNSSNNAFCLQVDGKKHKIVLEQGNYKINELCDTLENTMNNFLDIRVQYIEKTDKFQFYGDKEFEFKFSEKSTKSSPFNLGKVLGFQNKDYRSQFQNNSEFTGLSHIITAQFRKNFDEKNYVLLKISGFNVHHSISQIIDKTFAIIPETQNRQNYVSHFQRSKKSFNPPIARLSKLQISFVDQNGDLVDFQNHDHYFVIKFESFKHTRKYAAFIDMKM